MHHNGKADVCGSNVAIPTFSLLNIFTRMYRAFCKKIAYILFPAILNELKHLRLVALGLHNTIDEFNVDSNAECDQLNLSHVARKNIKRRN